MNTADQDHLPPAAWRSEAFAEDLFADDDTPAPAAPRHDTLRTALLGLLPAVLAGASAAWTTLGPLA
jgi:hypothetical protein